MRLIDADKIRYAKDWVVTDKIPKVGGYNAKAIYRVTKEEIDAMPTVDAVPVKHGRWMQAPHKKARFCSCCYSDEPYKFADDDANVFDFCPHCGAKMDGKDGEQHV